MVQAHWFMYTYIQQFKKKKCFYYQLGFHVLVVAICTCFALLHISIGYIYC